MSCRAHSIAVPWLVLCAVVMAPATADVQLPCIGRGIAVCFLLVGASMCMHGAHASSIVQTWCDAIVDSRCPHVARLNDYLIIRAHACVHAARRVRAYSEFYVEALGGVYRGTCGHGYRGRLGVELEGEAALQHGQRDHRLEQGKLVADALSLASTKWQVCKVGGHLQYA